LHSPHLCQAQFNIHSPPRFRGRTSQQRGRRASTGSKQLSVPRRPFSIKRQQESPFTKFHPFTLRDIPCDALGKSMQTGCKPLDAAPLDNPRSFLSHLTVLPASCRRRTLPPSCSRFRHALHSISRRCPLLPTQPTIAFGDATLKRASFCQVSSLPLVTWT
jgi:hypothetical protein